MTWKPLAIIALTILLLVSGLWPIVAFGYGWHAARHVQRRKRTVILL